MRLSEPRIPPTTEADWDEETRARYQRAADSGRRILNISLTLAHHPELNQRWGVFASHVFGGSTLPAREREILILRTGWRCQAEYEWAQHAIFGRDAGLTDDELRRITEGPDAGWSARDRLLLIAADELHDDQFISDATWEALGRDWNTQQLMDIVFTVGQYTLVSMALNSFGVQLEAGVGGFPE